MQVSNQSGQVITKQKAIEYISEFKAQNPNAINSYYVGIDKLQALLGQNNCIGMRIYPGLNKQTSLTNMVLVGVNQIGQDISDGTVSYTHLDVYKRQSLYHSSLCMMLHC